MRAIVAVDSGLVLDDIPTPDVGNAELLIRVHAAGVNRADLLQAQGLYPAPPGDCPRLGLEVSGVVEAVGPGVSGWQVGEAVCALVPGGGYADYVITPAVLALPIPDGVSLEAAASLPEACLTSWFALHEKARLASGETVLIHAGASGVGSMAIMMARAAGATVYATAGTPEKQAFCESLGAVAAFSYDSPALLERCKGVDVVLDVLGGRYYTQHVSLLARDGRLVSIALLDGKEATLNVARVVMKNLSLYGLTLRSQPLDYKGLLVHQVRRHVWPLLASGAIRPVVDRVYPLEQAAEAHALMEGRGHCGKVVLLSADIS